MVIVLYSFLYLKIILISTAYLRYHILSHLLRTDTWTRVKITCAGSLSSLVLKFHWTAMKKSIETYWDVWELFFSINQNVKSICNFHFLVFFLSLRVLEWREIKSEDIFKYFFSLQLNVATIHAVQCHVKMVGTASCLTLSWFSVFAKKASSVSLLCFCFF